MNEEPNSWRRGLPDLVEVVLEIGRHVLEFLLEILVNAALSIFDF